jgi:hypothetical protein
MDIFSSLVSNLEPALAIQPGQRPFHHPAVTPKLLARLDASTRNSRGDSSLPQCLPTKPKVIPLVSVQLARPLPWSPSWATNRLNSINRFLQHLAVVDVGCRMRYRERDSSSVDHKMALRARFSAIRWVRPGLFAPPGAGTLAESSEARDQSSWSDSPRRSSNTWWILFHTPASCQSRRRRQQVMPLPHPISWGSNSQGMPVRSTKSIPVSTLRSGMRGRPPFGLEGSGGISGAMISQSSSGNSGLAMYPLYITTEFC